MRFSRQKPVTTASRFGPVILGMALLALCGRVCDAQPPIQTAISEPWRTLDTEHFRIHFRPRASTFARSVAARVEAVRTEVGRLVGHFPERKYGHPRLWAAWNRQEQGRWAPPPAVVDA